MKRTFFYFTVFILTLTALGSCEKPCDPSPATCSDVPPNNELCQAAFQRWFFDKDENECEQIGYSGCSAVGFATKAECEACKCD